MLALGLLLPSLGLGDVDLRGRHRLLDQDLHQVLVDLEKAVRGCVDVALVTVGDPHRPRLDGRDQRRVVHQDAELAVRDPGDHHVHLGVEDDLLRRDDPAEQLPPLTPLLTLLAHWPSRSSLPEPFSEVSSEDSSSEDSSVSSSPPSSSSSLMPRAFSTASSMLPTR